MIFAKSTVPDPHNPTLIEAWSAGHELWRVEVNEVLFGRRVQVRHAWGHFYLADYCAGDDLDWQRALLFVIVTFLEKYREDVHPKVIENLFDAAVQERKPMHLAPDCWHLLTNFAGESRDHLWLANKALARGMLAGLPPLSFKAGERLTRAGGGS
jgi:hypothetical protein